MLWGDVGQWLRGNWSLRDKSEAKFGPDWSLRPTAWLQFPGGHHLMSPWMLASEATMLVVRVNQVENVCECHTTSLFDSNQIFHLIPPEQWVIIPIFLHSHLISYLKIFLTPIHHLCKDLRPISIGPNLPSWIEGNLQDTDIRFVFYGHIESHHQPDEGILSLLTDFLCMP